jgi:hypothetical protein
VSVTVHPLSSVHLRHIINFTKTITEHHK